MLDFNLGNVSNQTNNTLCCNEKQIFVISFMAVLAIVFLLLITYKYLWRPTPVSSRQGYMSIDGQSTNQPHQNIYDEPDF